MRGNGAKECKVDLKLGNEGEGEEEMRWEGVWKEKKKMERWKRNKDNLRTEKEDD